MKILTILMAGGALMLGTAFAQDAPKTAAPAALAASVTKDAKVKKHRVKHNKKAAAATTATPAASTAAPANVAPKK
jgi:hypothetical protein